MMTTFTTLLGVLLAAIFILLSAIHFYWAGGGVWGTSGSIPSKNGKALFKPTPLSTIVIAIALLAAAGILLGRVKLLPLGVFFSPLFYWGTWALAGAFLLRAIGDFNYVGFFKRVRNSDFAHWDTKLFSPLCLFISVGSILINTL